MLGCWQLERAEYKQARSLELSRSMSQAPKPLSEVDVPKLFTPYRLQGHYHEQHYLLDNRMRGGRIGYEVLSAFKLDGDDWVLVNRGWVPAAPYRHQLPDIEHVTVQQNLHGYFYRPDGSIPVLKDLQQEVMQPDIRRIQRVVWDAIEAEIPGAMLVRAEFRLSDQGGAGAYRLDWPPLMSDANKHKGYAVQWFAMSGALLLLMIWAIIKHRKELRAQTQTETA